MSTVTRKIKNVVKQYTYAEVKVREATSNDAWGPTPKQLDELTELSHHNVAVVEVLGIIWKRLSERGKNWRHVFKSLLVLDHLIKCGSEKVSHLSLDKIELLTCLSGYDFYEEMKDVGMMVREKSKQIVALLNDQDRLKNERIKMINLRRIRNQKAFSGEGSHSPVLQTETLKRKKLPSLGSVSPHPRSPGDDDYQLQVALLMSREEHEEEERKRNLEEIGLQAALEESRRVLPYPSTNGDLCSPKMEVRPDGEFHRNGTNYDSKDPIDSHKPVAKRLTLLSIARQHSNKMESPPIEHFDDGGNEWKKESYDPWEDLVKVFSSDVASSLVDDPWHSTNQKSVDMFGSVDLSVGPNQNSKLSWLDNPTTTTFDNMTTTTTVAFSTTQTTTTTRAMFSPTNPFYSTLTHQLVSVPTNASSGFCPITTEKLPWEQFSSMTSPPNRHGNDAESNEVLRDSSVNNNFKDFPVSFDVGLKEMRQQTNPFL